MQNKLKKLINQQNIDQEIISEIFIFGSFAKGTSHKKSDVDILILHRASSQKEYKYVINLFKNLKASGQEQNIFLDIFLVHIFSINFIIENFGIYLQDIIKTRKTIWKYKKIENYLKTKKSNKEQIYKANALLVFLEIFNNYPTVEHEKRLKNLKLADGVFTHFFKVSNYIDGIKYSQNRMRSINKESPYETISNDIRLLEKLTLGAQNALLLNVEMQTLADVKLARFYLMKLKEYRYEDFLDSKSFIDLLKKGLSSIFLHSSVFNHELPTDCINILQSLIDRHLYSSSNKKKINIVEDYSSLIKSFDLYINDL